jgi:hypothetical protein
VADLVANALRACGGLDAASAQFGAADAMTDDRASNARRFGARSGAVRIVRQQRRGRRLTPRVSRLLRLLALCTNPPKFGCNPCVETGCITINHS